MDLYITDPPYNVSLGLSAGHVLRPSEARQLHRRTDGLVIDNDAWDSDDEFVEFLSRAFDQGMAALKPGGVFYIWFSTSQENNFIQAAKRSGMEIRQILIWVKSIFVMGRQDYQWQHEPCLYGWKKGAAHYFTEARNLPTVFDFEIPVEKLKKEELQEILTKIRESYETSILREDKPTASKLHPTMKPLKLMARLIKNSSRPGETVLDTFGGSGSTLMACEQMGRRCLTMEIDTHYASVIIRRWEEFTGKKAIKEEHNHV